MLDMSSLESVQQRDHCIYKLYIMVHDVHVYQPYICIQSHSIDMDGILDNTYL